MHIKTICTCIYIWPLLLHFYVVFDDSLLVCCYLRISTWCSTCGLARPLWMPTEVLRYLTRNTRTAVRRETKGPFRSLLDYVISYLRSYYFIIIILFIFAIKNGFAAVRLIFIIDGTDMSSVLNLVILLHADSLDARLLMWFLLMTFLPVQIEYELRLL